MKAQLFAKYILIVSTFPNGEKASLNAASCPAMFGVLTQSVAQLAGFASSLSRWVIAGADD